MSMRSLENPYTFRLAAERGKSAENSQKSFSGVSSGELYRQPHAAINLDWMIKAIQARSEPRGMLFSHLASEILFGGTEATP